jgi:transcriptional regulator with XRE-family HTH domain
MKKKCRLRQARQLAGMTQDELALAVGLYDKSSISKIEMTGSARPATIVRLATALGYPAHLLFPGFPKPLPQVHDPRKKKEENK